MKGNSIKTADMPSLVCNTEDDLNTLILIRGFICH